MQKKLNINTIKKAKQEQPLTMITAYDALMAKLFNKTADLILVGDSLNMSFRGEPDTLSITLDMMIYHTQAVCNGAPDTFVICDMPFGTYTNKKMALKNATKVFQQSRADAVKIEGGVEMEKTIAYLTQNSVAVMGHIGLLPQNVRSEGGYRVKGKDEDSAEQLIKDAQAVERAGAFAMVIEGVKAEVATKVAQSVSIPVIGIGAGAGVDGQVLVWSDMFGFFEEFTPKFVKKYLNGAELMKEGLARYKGEVQSRTFPEDIHTY